MKQLLCRALLISMCSITISACGWWGGEVEIEPAELVDFEAEKEVDVLWSQSVGAGLGEAFNKLSLAINGDAIYALDVEGAIVAFDRHNGSALWQVELDTPLVGGVGVGPNHVAVATESGEIVMLSADDGTEMWRQQMSSETLSPVQMNTDMAVAQLQNGKLVAMDISSGDHLWTYDSQIPRLTLRGTSAPIVAANVTIAGFANGKLVAVRNDSGAALWERQVTVPEGKTELERLIDIDSRPLYIDGVVYIVSYQGKLVAVSASDAQILWTQDASSYQSLAAGFGNIYVSQANGFIEAFDQRSSASVWRQAALENRQSTSTAVLGTTVVVGDFEGYLHFMSQIDGHFVARYKVDSDGLRGDMAVMDDVLYVLGNGGRLAALQLN
ncbi:outer membrane protein assembly factor BamB [Amphritea sp. 1_MG-2023]|uniref:outer membrane protein assembly factor BamB n=1 Tax=Amphritea sp. 1_MG-2023 TaxID=3062670 RepID=UPI0026E47278|nr:outer membrane protein assembly factor BamB [Amphritea sp. 1_MG-2023]MDO6564873.1 outer membrane protein assembly factor BamB [Amphritea sp. 1_MG-2023]